MKKYLYITVSALLFSCSADIDSPEAALDKIFEEEIKASPSSSSSGGKTDSYPSSSNNNNDISSSSGTASQQQNSSGSTQTGSSSSAKAQRTACEPYNPAMQFCDTRDYKVYNFKEIGGLIWMTENLNYEMSTGSACYENKENNCEEYGMLYTWDAAMSACNIDKGWHLPTYNYVVASAEEDWNKLVNYVNDEATKLKSIGTNTSGFSAKFGGIFDSAWNDGNGIFIYKDYQGDWWTSAADGYYEAYFIGLDNHPNVFGDSGLKADMRSVRCVKDPLVPLF